METKDLIKYGLLAVAAYLVYQWLQQNGMFGSTPAVAAAAGTTPGLPAGAVLVNADGTPITDPAVAAAALAAANAAAAQAATAAAKLAADQAAAAKLAASADPYGIAARLAETVAAPWVGAAPADAVLMLAAWDQSKAGTTGNFRLGASQWNWYRTNYAQNVLHLPDDKATQYPTLEGICGDCSNMTASEYWAALKASGLSGLGSSWGSGYAYGTGGGNRYMN